MGLGWDICNAVTPKVGPITKILFWGLFMLVNFILPVICSF